MSRAAGLEAGDAARLAWGSALLVAPDRLSRALTATPLGPGVEWAVRALALRTLAQTLLVARSPSRERLLLDAGVDAVHAASMIAVVLARGRYARPAALSAAVAAASALDSARQSRRLSVQMPPPFVSAATG